MDTLDEEPGAASAAGAPTRSWPELWRVISTIPGWLTEDQALALRTAVRALPAGSVVLEIGAHRGRSTTVLATARADVQVVTIDPFIRSRLLPGPEVEAELRANLAMLGVTDRVQVLATTSRRARAMMPGPIDLLWIDGRHDVLSLWYDLHWTRLLPPGGPVLIHDAFSSVGVTTGLALNQVLPFRRLRYRRRTGSLADFVHEPPTWRSRLRFAGNLPWWGRNLAVKVLLRLRLRALARRALGHTISADPF